MSSAWKSKPFYVDSLVISQWILKFFYNLSLFFIFNNRVWLYHMCFFNSNFYYWKCFGTFVDNSIIFFNQLLLICLIIIIILLCLLNSRGRKIKISNIEAWRCVKYLINLLTLVWLILFHSEIEWYDDRWRTQLWMK